jgi:hypothetical protein
VNFVASSVASTAKPLAWPSDWTAATPCGIEPWRKPAVFEKTRTFSSGSAACAGVLLRAHVVAASSAMAAPLLKRTEHLPSSCARLSVRAL